MLRGQNSFKLMADDGFRFIWLAARSGFALPHESVSNDWLHGEVPIGPRKWPCHPLIETNRALGEKKRPEN
jgi:hypothetical protein